MYHNLILKKQTDNNRKMKALVFFPLAPSYNVKLLKTHIFYVGIILYMYIGNFFLFYLRNQHTHTGEKKKYICNLKMSIVT